MQTVLVLSHTDIRYDNRILKEMEALAECRQGLRVVGIGVELDEGAARSDCPASLEIQTLSLWSRRVAAAWPRFLRHSLVMAELIVRMVARGRATGASVVHCHDTMVLPVGLLLRLVLGACLVYDAHELESDKNGGTRILSAATLVVERLAWPFVDLFITVSPSIEHWYHEKFGPRRSVVVLNAPQVGSAPSPYAREGYLRERFCIPADAVVFLYVGLLAPGRGLTQLLEIFAGTQGRSHVVLVGYGALRGACEIAARERPRIHVHDAVPHAHVVSLIRSADVGLCLIEPVSLSDYYCLPNKLFEYAFAGVPVLASDFPELRRVVERHRLGAVTALDATALREAIARCEAEPFPPVADSVSELSWGEQTRILLEAYDTLLASRHA
jgi:glycosyltransferase involved in cell wall biosynthesis